MFFLNLVVRIPDDVRTSYGDDFAAQFDDLQKMIDAKCSGQAVKAALTGTAAPAPTPTSPGTTPPRPRTSGSPEWGEDDKPLSLDRDLDLAKLSMAEFGGSKTNLDFDFAAEHM